MSESGGKLSRGAGPAAKAKDVDDPAYVPPASADHTPQARFARVGAQRAGAAAQISRSLQVWRKASEGADAGAADAGAADAGDKEADEAGDKGEGAAGGAEAKGDEKEEAKKEEKEGDGDESASAQEGEKEEGAEKEGEEGGNDKVKESAPDIGAKLYAKIYRAGGDKKTRIKGVTYSGRNVVVIGGNAYYQSSGQANQLGGIQKPVGAWYQIWGCQEKAGEKFFGNDVPEGWVMKQTHVNKSLVSGPDMTPYEIEYGADMGTPQQLNAWIRSQGAVAYSNVNDTDPTKKK